MTNDLIITENQIETTTQIEPTQQKTFVGGEFIKQLLGITRIPPELFAFNNVEDVEKALAPIREAQLIQLLQAISQAVITDENIANLQKSRNIRGELIEIFKTLKTRPAMVIIAEDIVEDIN